MTVSSSIFKDKVLVTGWCLTAASFLVFVLTMNLRDDSLFGGVFLVHFVAAAMYTLLPAFRSNRNYTGFRMNYHAIKLVLFLISAYALNREMTVFASSAPWLCVVLVVVCVNYLAGAFFYDAPQPLRYLMLFINGVALVVFAYFSFYLMPMYIFSIVALIAVGISIHTFIPLLFSIYTIMLTKHMAGDQKRYWVSFSAGIASAILVCVVYVMAWGNSVRQINFAYAEASGNRDAGQLPVWVQVAQHTDNNGMTEKVLKQGLVYKSFDWGDNFFWNMPQRNFTDERLHDPLVIIASLFSSPVELSENDRIKVLESGYHARHQALQRLWTGEDLATPLVNTTVKIWPQLHLAYTEKLITVSNRRKQAWWEQEEAIYTFHLPEGAVVTALSLWIKDHEEKGLLTSKGKATHAYDSIVGYERRDPSVVYWQEGNTVTVRVFPVTPGENRTFKIGITAPLRQEDGQLDYDNTWFEGPDASDAQETVKVEMTSDPRSFIQSNEFTTGDARTFTTHRRYQPLWTLGFYDLGLQPHSFSFDGSSYTIQPYQKQRVPAAITDVYLDINNSWTPSELADVLDAVKGRHLWVYYDYLQQLDEVNRKPLLATLNEQRFSIFPFYRIPNRTHALVVSKSSAYTPNIHDLETSSFLDSLRANAGGERIRLFHIGSDISPYLRSLHEFRMFDFEFGKPQLLKQLLDQGQFVHDEETDSSVIIHTAGVTIAKTPGTVASNAPDHLMRLFAYNHILQQMGAHGLKHDEDDSTLVDEAQTAYVVSPVSSLIVLESQKDYDQFGIKNKGNSLGNATKGNQGAVPEPGEWAIIIIVLLAFGFFFFKWRSL